MNFNTENNKVMSIHISHRLNDPAHQLRSLSGVAEDLAQKLIEYLLKNRLLKNKTLNAFIPW
jgi:hypothetical protein